MIWAFLKGLSGLGSVGFDDLLQRCDADFNGTGGVLTHGHEQACFFPFLVPDDMETAATATPGAVTQPCQGQKQVWGRSLSLREKKRSQLEDRKRKDMWEKKHQCENDPLEDNEQVTE